MMNSEKQENISVVTKTETKKWSGGTTTQLYIFPKNTNYIKRNFTFRISTATVETESSEFTKLPNFSRILMILNGNIEINHKNRYSKKLEKFDTDNFEGYWETFSIGKCTDFNIMTNGVSNVEILAKSITKNNNIVYIPNTKSDFLFIYIYKGEVSFTIDNKKMIFKENDFIEINNKQDKIIIDVLIYSEIIISDIIL